MSTRTKVLPHHDLVDFHKQRAEELRLLLDAGVEFADILVDGGIDHRALLAIPLLAIAPRPVAGLAVALLAIAWLLAIALLATAGLAIAWLLAIPGLPVGWVSPRRRLVWLVRLVGLRVGRKGS